MSTGYSGTPLVKKLGIKVGYRVIFVHPPADYEATLGALPPDVKRDTILEGEFDFIHFFTKSRVQLEEQFPSLKDAIKADGILWISWPKTASRVKSDLTENIVREIGLENGLVDVKVAAIDAVWSGLKFVYRLKDRYSAPLV